MHILFIGYGRTSQKVAQYLFEHDHQVTTISRSEKIEDGAKHLIQDIFSLKLNNLPPIDLVYVLLSPDESSIDAYKETYLKSIESIYSELKHHPVQRIIIVSSTRVYGEHHGEVIDDDSHISPQDEQGEILLAMERAWQKAYPTQSIIVRPTGIYGHSVERMIKIAKTKSSYPNIHFSNRIHVEDLARFLAQLADQAQVKPSYIVTNNQPLPLHEVIIWFQKTLNLPLLSLSSTAVSGKKIYATHMQQEHFKLHHADCFEDYLKLLNR